MLLGHAIYLKGLGLLTDGGMSDLAFKMKNEKEETEKDKSLSAQKEKPRCQL